MTRRLPEEVLLAVRWSSPVHRLVHACEFLQCTVLGKHGAVSDDATLRGRDVIFFLKQAKIISRCRYVPGMPRPGVSK